VAKHGNSVCVPPSFLPQINPVQQSWDGVQGSASCEQVCGPRQLQLESPAAHGARAAFWQVTPSPFGQQGFVVEHDSPCVGQAARGISQLQGSPATHGCCTVEPSVWKTQLSPVQQFGAPAVQA
jgi:hypothetical protein